MPQEAKIIMQTLIVFPLNRAYGFTREPCSLSRR
jgi:hypothetical protein